MDYALEERIGDPYLFTGRKEELTHFLKWINDIKERKSMSTAIMARRKMGKTTIIERLFNIIFFKNDGLIPFYYEIKEKKIWIVDFCRDFFLTFIYHYIAFKTRKKGYLTPEGKNSFTKVKTEAVNEDLEYLTGIIESVEYAVEHEQIDSLWETVRTAPHTIAARQNEFIVQMIDEFQFMNAMIYRDKNLNKLQDDLAGGYLSTAESKIAPLLISGSWVGWLMDELNFMLPSRFRYEYLGNMPQDEAAEVVYKFSRYFDVPVSEEIAFLLIEIAEGSPFYISSIIRSRFQNKDLTTIKGLSGTLEFETLDDRGLIKSTWMEYIGKAFPKINDQNAKNIVLHLSKHRDRELTRDEIREALSLEISDGALEKKLKALVKTDIINQGSSNFRYRGVNDNIFDKVFRGVYEEEILKFDAKVIRKEYSEELKKEKRRYTRLLGKYNYRKGYFAQYLLLEQLRLHARDKNELLKSLTRYLPVDFDFCDYSRVWMYNSSPEYAKSFSLDIFARARSSNDYSIIGEVKSRDLRKFSREEAVGFLEKLREVESLERVERAVGFIFSRSGFTREAENYCKEMGIACSEDERWLGV
jgi:hypothetical protein